MQCPIHTHTTTIHPVPTGPLYLPDPCTYQTPVPTRLLYLPDPCTYQTPVPTRPLYLPDPCAYQTPVPTRPLYLPDPCTYQTPVPTRPLYLPDPCTYQTPVPTRPLYLPDPCTYQTPVLDGDPILTAGLLPLAIRIAPQTMSLDMAADPPNPRKCIPYPVAKDNMCVFTCVRWQRIQILLGVVVGGWMLEMC